MAGFSLRAPLQEYASWGTFLVQQEAAAGELTLDLSVPMQPGPWRAWYLGPERLDELVAHGLAPDDAADQLVLVHSEAQAPDGIGLPDVLQHVGTVSLEGARFTLACTSLCEDLKSESGFYEHLDGVHGLLRRGGGVHVMLEGDGRAVIWVNPTGTMVVVEIT